MRLKGSCHCSAVKFELDSAHPYPFNVCYCSVCRKTAGGGGYAINLGGDAESLRIVEGADAITCYQIRLGDGSASPCERRFCRFCGSALWVWDPRWPELIHPFASAIDSELPVAPEQTHLMEAYKASWVQSCKGERDLSFQEYPEESIAEWHQRLRLEQ